MEEETDNICETKTKPKNGSRSNFSIDHLLGFKQAHQSCDRVEDKPNFENRLENLSREDFPHPSASR